MNAIVYDTPDRAEEAFYEAFEHRDLEAMMAVWADDDTIVCVHPGGERIVGRDAIAEAWRQIFLNGSRLEFQLLHCHALSDEGVVVHSVLEEIRVEGRPAFRATVAATNVFVLTDGGWRLWMHHGSNTSQATESASDPATDSKPTLH